MEANEQMLRNLGALVYGMTTDKTFVTVKMEKSLVVGESFAVKCTLIHGNGTKATSHQELVTATALAQIGDPQVIADAILQKIYTEAGIRPSGRS
jgi:hypothetical protein